MSDFPVNEDSSITVTLEAINADSADNVTFRWSAASGNSNQSGSLGYLRSTNVSIQLKIVNTGASGNPTIYTTNPTSQLIQLSMAKGGGSLL